MRRTVTGLAALVALSLTAVPAAQSAGKQVGLNVVLSTDLTPAIVAELAGYGTVNDQYPELDAVTMRVPTSAVGKISKLPYVATANEDAERVGKPVEMTEADWVAEGMTTWNTDQIDVMDWSFEYDEAGEVASASSGRDVAQTGAGVYVAVLDTGLHSSWPYYFGDRIAAEYGVAFGGGGGEKGAISTQPNKWSLDQDGHGTHVTSSVLGYNFGGTIIGGVAPEAKVIPVKVLNQNGSGWSSVVAAGIDYVRELKEGPIADHPVVINMSLGGPVLDAIEKRAIDEAIAAGVVIVASAGNSGEAGMGYPGAYEPVISVAATGWTDFTTFAGDVGEDGTDSTYIADFSSRALPGQDLDVAAPGAWVVGPYQTNGQLSYYYLSGTSMAAPHVTGAVALMAEARAADRDVLTQADAEDTLECTARAIVPADDVVVQTPAGPQTLSWGADATGHGLIDVPAAIAGDCVEEEVAVDASVQTGKGSGKVNPGKGNR